MPSVLMRPDFVDTQGGRVTLSPFREVIKCDDQFKQLAAAFSAVAGTVGVAHLFPSSSQSWREDGQLNVRLYANNSWEEISINTSLDSDQGKELSLPFVLKAIGKRNLEISSQIDCLRYLTGGIVHHVRLAEVTEDAVWKFLSQKFPITDFSLAVTLECRTPRRDKIPEKIPIVVLDLVEIFDGTATPQRLVKLLLPFSDHSETPWGGSFSPSDPFWTKHPEMREKLKFAGNAWCMLLADVARIFTDLYVAQIFPENFPCKQLATKIDQIVKISDHPTPPPPHVPAKALLSGREKSGFFADEKFPHYTQVSVKAKNSLKPLYVTVDLSFEEGDFAPVTLTAFLGRGRRIWKFVEADVLTRVTTDRPHERMLALTIENPGDRKFFLVLSQADMHGSSRVLKGSNFRVFAESEVTLLPAPAVHVKTIEGVRFPMKHGGSFANNPIHWSMNPEALLDFKRDDRTSLMVVVKTQEAITGISVGKTTCAIPRLPSTALNTHALLTSAKKRVLEKLQSPVHPEFSASAQSLPVGNIFVEESSKCIFLENLTKEDFPLAVVPWRSDNTEISDFDISVLSDFPLDHCELFDGSRSFRCVDAWSPSRRNLGNHSTWNFSGKIPTEGVCAYRLISSKDLTLRISIIRDLLGENENLVDAMLSFYVLKDGRVVKTANFTPGSVLTEDLALKAGESLDLLPVTYKPNKRGEFLFEVDAVGHHIRGQDWQIEPL